MREFLIIRKAERLKLNAADKSQPVVFSELLQMLAAQAEIFTQSQRDQTAGSRHEKIACGQVGNQADTAERVVVQGKFRLCQRVFIHI